MRNSSKSPEIFTKTKKFTFYIAAAWTLVFIGALTGEAIHHQGAYEELAESVARAYFDKDQAFRSWAGSHGGVYVPTDKRTPPNPFLSHVPERDISTPSGKALTLMNPAYMLRQLNEEFSEMYEVAGHITSLKPRRPENAPDEWERAALQVFEQGEDEVSEFVQKDGQPYLRMMRPMLVEADCLKCHAIQGYQQGDVRGGVSISVPMANFHSKAQDIVFQSAIALGIVWILGLGGIYYAFKRINTHILERENVMGSLQEAYNELEGKMIEINELNKELKAFDYSVSNALRVPLRHVESFTKIVLEDHAADLQGEALAHLGLIQSSAEELREMLDAMLDLSKAGRQNISRERVDLSQIAGVVVASLQREEYQPKVEVDIQPGITCLGDYKLLHLVLYNLLENSFRFSANNPNARVEFGESRTDDMVVYCVSDNGVGFAQERASSLFIPFHSYHTGTEFAGIGLGLATAKRIIQRHGGIIWAEGEVGKGANFYFTLR